MCHHPSGTGRCSLEQGKGTSCNAVCFFFEQRRRCLVCGHLYLLGIADCLPVGWRLSGTNPFCCRVLDLTLSVCFLVTAILGQMPFRHWSNSSDNLLSCSRPWPSVKLTSEKSSHLQLDAGRISFVLPSLFSIFFQ